MGRFYKQVSGLEMGASCCPDLSNLYAAAMENQNIARFMRHPQVQGFGHHIDDTPAVVWAQDRTSCSVIFSRLEFSPLQIEWNIVEEG